MVSQQFSLTTVLSTQGILYKYIYVLFVFPFFFFFKVYVVFDEQVESVNRLICTIFLRYIYIV